MTQFSQLFALKKQGHGVEWNSKSIPNQFPRSVAPAEGMWEPLPVVRLIFEIIISHFP